MPTIQIDSLTPGEAALSAEKVGKYLSMLKGRQMIPPITVIEIEGRKIVRDGNNRVRALIEYYANLRAPCPEIEFELSKTQVPPSPFLGLRKMASFYPAGPDAFIRLRKASASEYDRVQGEEGRRIWAATPTII